MKIALLETTLFPAKMLEEQAFFVFSLLISVFLFTNQCLICLSVHFTPRQSIDIDSIMIATHCICYWQCNLQLGFVQKSKGDIFVLQLSQKFKWEHNFLRFLLCDLLRENNEEEQIKIILLWVCKILDNSIGTNGVCNWLCLTHTQNCFSLSHSRLKYSRVFLNTHGRKS